MFWRGLSDLLPLRSLAKAESVNEETNSAHSARSLTPDVAHLRSAGARLRNPTYSAGRPLPSSRREPL